MDTPHDMPESMQRYLEMWNESDATKRRALIEVAVAADMEFADPEQRHVGRDALAQNTDRFHERFPGATLFATSHVDVQHRRHRYTWRIVVGGDVLMDGMDVTTLDEVGLIQRVDGFFGPVRPLDA